MREQYSSFEPDDPAGTAERDQTHAESLDRLREAQGWMLVVANRGEDDQVRFGLLFWCPPDIDTESFFQNVSAGIMRAAQGLNGLWET